MARRSNMKHTYVAAVISVNEHANAAGSNAKWPPTAIIDKTGKKAGKCGKRGILATGNNTASVTPSTVNATACCKNNAMPNAARNILQRWMR